MSDSTIHWLRLSHAHDQSSVYVRLDRIVSIAQGVGDGNTWITLLEKEYVTVAESPDEVMKLMPNMKWAPIAVGNQE